MGNNHIYTKKEISKILKKASEIQTQKDLYGDKDGLSEQEILELANEVGIDRASLLEAIHIHDKPGFDQEFIWTKATSKIQEVTYIDGEMPSDLWEDVVQEIRKITGGIGKSTQIGNSFEWEQRREMGYKHISLTPKDGKTKIQYVHNWSALKIPFLFLPAFMGSVILLVALKGLGMPKSTAVMFAPIGGLAAFTGGLVYLRYHFDKQKNRLKSMINSLSKKINSPNTPKIKIEDEEIYNDMSETKQNQRIKS
ncbi:MAG: hypothetical protein ROO71_03270 [Balneola sp.]